MLSERKGIGTTSFRSAYESFRRSRDESLTRNNSKRTEERQILTSTLSSMNSNLLTTFDEFFHTLANFDRPITLTLKGVYKQVRRDKFFYLILFCLFFLLNAKPFKGKRTID